ncbi:MAG: guanylate kinase [Dehalococcoidia bacterium]|nr:guanylate kinase [Dehalococcoidia bacterium]
MPKSNKSLVLPVPPLFIILSGPSGVGKDAILTRLKAEKNSLQFVTTMTTRPRRPAEIDGVDYRFVTKAHFEKLMAKNELLESANVYGNWYGVPKQAVRDALDKGKDVIVKVDVQGAATIKKIAPEAVFIFLMPPSLEELGNRLRLRYTEKPPELAVRLQAAQDEMKQVSRFDYVVMNNSGGINEAASRIKAIITAEKCRVVPRRIILP